MNLIEAQKIKFGQIVTLADDAIEQGLRGQADSSRGVVLAHDQSHLFVCREGIKSPRWYHRDHWLLVQ